MNDIVKSILGNEEFRGFVASIAVAVVAEVLHRRSVDPDYLKHSDETFAALAAAKTPEDQAHAQNALRTLLAG